MAEQELVKSEGREERAPEIERNHQVLLDDFLRANNDDRTKSVTSQHDSLPRLSLIGESEFEKIKKISSIPEPDGLCTGFKIELKEDQPLSYPIKGRSLSLRELIQIAESKDQPADSGNSPKQEETRSGGVVPGFHGAMRPIVSKHWFTESLLKQKDIGTERAGTSGGELRSPEKNNDAQFKGRFPSAVSFGPRPSNSPADKDPQMKDNTKQDKASPRK